MTTPQQHGRRERGDRPRDTRPKRWVVCPKCDALAGLIYEEFLKPSGAGRGGDQHHDQAHGRNDGAPR